MNALVCGGGGFIGGHLIKRLLADGHRVRAVDIKALSKWWQLDDRAENISADLEARYECYDAADGMDAVFNLAADMGGIGYIENNKAACMLSVLINTHLLMAARLARVQRYFYSSSACAYHADLQKVPEVVALKEEDAYYNGGAMPEDGYGWEKLFSERMCRHFYEDHRLETRVARFHNCYGPKGSWFDGREKAPAAMCRKIAQAKLTRNHVIDVWGDGTRTRTFMWIDDCVDGILRLTWSDIHEPLNLGTAELVSVNGLIDLVEEIAGVKVERQYDLTKPQGVFGRSSDNTKIRNLLGWEPTTPLRVGLEKTYEWIERQVAASL